MHLTLRTLCLEKLNVFAHLEFSVEGEIHVTVLLIHVGIVTKRIHLAFSEFSIEIRHIELGFDSRGEGRLGSFVQDLLHIDSIEPWVFADVRVRFGTKPTMWIFMEETLK